MHENLCRLASEIDKAAGIVVTYICPEDNCVLVSPRFLDVVRDFLSSDRFVVTTPEEPWRMMEVRWNDNTEELTTQELKLL